jgi:hypothetical protein
MARGDREFLRAYASGQAPRADDESVEDYAKRIGADPGPAPAPAPSPAPAPAPGKGKPATPPAPPAEPKPGDPKPGDKPGDKPGGLLGNNPAAKVGKAARDGLADKVEGWRDKLANLPTPGGSGAIFLILILFVFLIVPVAAGYTRMQLFWLTILGRTSLPADSAPSSGAGQSEPDNKPASVSSSPNTGGVTARAAELSAPSAPAMPRLPLPMPGGSGTALPRMRM